MGYTLGFFGRVVYFFEKIIISNNYCNSALLRLLFWESLQYDFLWFKKAHYLPFYWSMKHIKDMSSWMRNNNEIINYLRFTSPIPNQIFLGIKIISIIYFLPFLSSTHNFPIKLLLLIFYTHTIKTKKRKLCLPIQTSQISFKEHFLPK